MSKVRVLYVLYVSALPPRRAVELCMRPFYKLFEWPKAVFFGTREVSASRYGRPAHIRPEGARLKVDTSLTSWSNFPTYD